MEIFVYTISVDLRTFCFVKTTDTIDQMKAIIYNGSQYRHGVPKSAVYFVDGLECAPWRKLRLKNPSIGPPYEKFT